MILVLLIHWQRQITTWWSGYQSFDLVKKRSQGWESKGWEYFSGGFRWKARLQNCGLSAASAGGCSISHVQGTRLCHSTALCRCTLWLHPLLNSPWKPFSLTTSDLDPGLSCETDRRSQLESGRKPRCKIHFWLDRRVFGRAKGELPCFRRGRVGCCRWPFKSSGGPLFPCSCNQSVDLFRAETSRNFKCSPVHSPLIFYSLL